MYKIKQIPEDFIVKEVNEVKLDNKGKYSYFLLKKKSYNTLRAVQLISEKTNIKNIGFAGNKDKNAITEQIISIYNGNKNIEKLNLKDIELKYLGKGNEEMYIGNLKRNEFIITIRNLEKKEIDKIQDKDVLIPNYFGEQRFSNKNYQIGKEIIKKDFKKAVELVIETNPDCVLEIKEHLKAKEHDFIGALRIIPLKLLKLYVHAYQSFIFNKTLDQFIDKKIENIPIVGFGTELDDSKSSKIITKLLEKEKITLRDFIIRQIPDLSSEGSERKTFVKINDFKIIEKKKDELNKGKEKVTVSFSLPKGSYATVFIDYLFMQKQP